MLSPETVERAFRLILGRAPESADVVEAHRRLPDEAALRETLLASPEFVEGHAARLARAGSGHEPDRADLNRAAEAGGAAQGVLLPREPVETEADGAARARLWQRVARSWAALGREAPHWSVLTHEAFRPESLEANREAFGRSALAELELVDIALARLPGLEAGARDCLEIGCGVGRVTGGLAARFRRVIAVDISPEHLRIAEEELAAAGIGNVTTELMRRVEDYAALPPVGFLFTRIVLQHNPPPVQAAILRAALGRIEPGGAALFQVVTHGRDYRYSVADDLARADAGMEMHVLPQARVFELIAAAGMIPVEVQEDFAAGNDGVYRSHLFLARRPAAGEAGPMDFARRGG